MAPSQLSPWILCSAWHLPNVNLCLTQWIGIARLGVHPSLKPCWLPDSRVRTYACGRVLIALEHCMHGPCPSRQGQSLMQGSWLGGTCCLVSPPTSRLLVPQTSSAEELCIPIMATKPSFPPEILGLVLNSLCCDRTQDDLTCLWTSLRHVCHHFKVTIENTFKTDHIPKTWLHCSMSKFPYSRRPGSILRQSCRRQPSVFQVAANAFTTIPMRSYRRIVTFIMLLHLIPSIRRLMSSCCRS